MEKILGIKIIYFKEIYKFVVDYFFITDILFINEKC